MWDRLHRVTPPVSPVVSLAEAKAHVRCDGSADDDVLNRMVADATARIEGPNGAGIALVSQVWELTLDRFPAAITLPLGPVLSVDTITYRDAGGESQALASSTWRAATRRSPAQIWPAGGQAWPGTDNEPEAVTVRFTAGFGGPADVPADLRGAVLLLVGHFYANREAVVANPGISQALELPFGAAAVIDAWRVGRFG